MTKILLTLAWKIPEVFNFYDRDMTFPLNDSKLSPFSKNDRFVGVDIYRKGTKWSQMPKIT